ncbi:MAG: prepilin-type N-terminal cleavage/methylation domain-containing protein [Verrucomicrobiota bacterium]|nr:prepilin-type N-terminal cleavage/methylation domain-containing protein [Verrucomicrobiota bacterium]
MKKSTNGFTLVEIMVVVAIIALLAAIAVPNFLRARTRAQATRVLNDVRMISSAAEQYAIEYGLSSDSVVTFNSLIGHSYLKSGSSIYNGQTAVLLPTGGTLGDIYSAISPTRKLTVDNQLRAYFLPTLSTDDRIWD